ARKPWVSAAQAKAPAGSRPAGAFVLDSRKDQAVAWAFWISRLIFSALTDSSSSFDLAKKASRPPRWSTVRRAAAEIRSWNDLPRVSEIRVTSFRFGRNRRRFLLLAWLMVLPDIGPLPVNSQTRDILVFLRFVKTEEKRGIPTLEFDCGHLSGIGGGVKQEG